MSSVGSANDSTVRSEAVVARRVAARTVPYTVPVVPEIAKDPR